MRQILKYSRFLILGLESVTFISYGILSGFNDSLLTSGSFLGVFKGSDLSIDVFSLQAGAFLATLFENKTRFWIKLQEVDTKSIISEKNLQDKRSALLVKDLFWSVSIEMASW